MGAALGVCVCAADPGLSGMALLYATNAEDASRW